jgi:hypothetical protein
MCRHLKLSRIAGAIRHLSLSLSRVRLDQWSVEWLRVLGAQLTGSIFVHLTSVRNLPIEVNNCCHFGLNSAHVGIGIGGISLRHFNLPVAG